MVGIKDVQMALDTIVAGTAAKFDLIKVLTDYEDESQIPEKLMWEHRRYLTNSGCLSLPPKMAVAAKPFKACCGNFAYTIAALKVTCCDCSRQDIFEIEIDGEKIENKAGSNEHSTV